MKILQELCKSQGEASLFKRLHQEEDKANSSKTDKKVKATKKATKVRQDVARNKIENSLNMMRLFGEKITVYTVAKHANVSYNTANKYRDFIK